MKNKLVRVVLMCLVGHSIAPGEIVGWAVRCSGHWEDQTKIGQPITLPCKEGRTELWHKISRESKLAVIAHKHGQWIDIRIARTGETHRFDCDQLGECDPPPVPFARLVPREHPPGLLQWFLDAPGEAYARVRLTLSRSDNDDTGWITADHAVIAQGDPISLHNLLRATAPPGRYLLELCRFDPENGCPSGQMPISVEWTPGSSALWPQAADAGLFEIVRSRVVDGMTLRTEDRGLLLVVPKQKEATVREQVKAGEELFLQTWANKSEGRLMFRALLLDIASKRDE